MPLGPEGHSPTCLKFPRSGVEGRRQEGELNPGRCPNPTCPTTNALKRKSLSVPVVSSVFSITITFNYFSSKVYNIFFPLLCSCFSACPPGKGHQASTFLLGNELWQILPMVTSAEVGVLVGVEHQCHREGPVSDLQMGIPLLSSFPFAQPSGRNFMGARWDTSVFFPPWKSQAW